MNSAQTHALQTLDGSLMGQAPTTTNPYAYTGTNNWAAQGSSNPFSSFGGNPFAHRNFANNEFAYGGGNQFSQAGAPQNTFQQSGGQNPYASLLGGYASGTNPHLDAMFGQAAQATQNQLTSEFARSGRNLEAREPILNQITPTAQGRNCAPELRYRVT